MRILNFLHVMLRFAIRVNSGGATP